MACWEGQPSQHRSFERCCLGKPAICTTPENVTAWGNSQHRQDQWVLEWLGCPTNRFYIDIGAYDGELLSNTHAMDMDLSWKGLCIDAILNPLRFARRSCAQVQAVVYNVTGEEVVFRHFEEFNSNAHAQIQLNGAPALAGLDDRVGPQGSLGKDATLGTWKHLVRTTTTMTNLLENVRMAIPRIIDFISIDVEGVVLQVLEGFPFERFCVRVWTLEVEGPDVWNITRLLYPHGYAMVEVLKLDRVFVHMKDCRGFRRIRY